MVIQYDGSNFYGWQRLNKKRTVQKEIEKVLKKVTYKKVKINGAGRTDALAHAKGQIANFVLDLKIPLTRFKEVLNRNLPDDIFIKNVEEVEYDFHSRYNSKGKRYRYKIYTSKDKKVFLNKYSYHYPYELNIEKMIEASKKIVGKKDFRSFTAKSSEKLNTVRHVKKIEIKINDEFIDIIVIGDGFLYKMVRTIVGNLLAVGRNLISVNDIEEIIDKKDIREAKFTAPANGLYLEEVFY